MGFRARFACGVTSLAVVAAAVNAQDTSDSRSREGGAGSPGAAARDSSAVHRAARAAQVSFERARRRYLPRRHSASPSRCDEIIGRFCFWNDEPTEDQLLRSVTPPESPKTIEARAHLLALLDSASLRLPGDEWIAGIHVHYLVEANRLGDAEHRARACGAPASWCAALGGLVEHAAWRYAAADSLFAVALAGMSEAERCEWTDLEELLAEPLRAEYHRASCVERTPINARLWWLADPLLLRSGNDRRTEHYARVARARIHRRAASPYAVTWRDDLGEMVRRYGWPSHFTVGVPQAASTDPPPVTLYTERPSYHFLPDLGTVGDVRSLRDSAWILRPLRSRERYAPPYATFAPLAHQTTQFRRGDSVLVVVAYDASTDSLLGAHPTTAALVASRGPDADTDWRALRHRAPRRGTTTLVVPDTALLASLELVAGARVRRARFGVGFLDAPDRALRMSDLGFFDPDESLPDDLEGFLPLARAHGSIAAGGQLGLFWEMYGTPPADDELSLDVEIVRDGGGWLRRAGERAGLVGPPTRVRLGWRESPKGGSIAARSFVVDLRELDPGRYRIEVRITPKGELPLIASRRIEIAR